MEIVLRSLPIPSGFWTGAAVLIVFFSIYAIARYHHHLQTTISQCKAGTARLEIEIEQRRQQLLEMRMVEIDEEDIPREEDVALLRHERLLRELLHELGGRVPDDEFDPRAGDRLLQHVLGEMEGNAAHEHLDWMLNREPPQELQRLRNENRLLRLRARRGAEAGGAAGTAAGELSPQSLNDSGLQHMDAARGVWTAPSLEFDMDEDDKKCTICWAEFEVADKTITLTCDHCFHAGCIGAWFERKIECAKCTRKLVWGMA